VKSICNFGYARSKKGGAHFPDVRGLLKYLQYRDDRDDHIPGGGGPDRWVDGGLGDSYPKILARLNELSAGNPHAYCFAVVISPDPEAIAAWRGSQDVEDDPQAHFVEAVKASMAEWEMWREKNGKPQAGPIEYSFVVHRPERNYGEQMHAHLILPATTENAMNGDLTPLYNNRLHVDAFKEIVYRQLDRVYELDQEQAVPEIELEQTLETGLEFAEREIPFHEACPGEEGA
jgi:hypothetical protein